MTMMYHKEHLLDRAVMLALRAVLSVQPTLEFGPEARPGFDELMAKTPAAKGVAYEATTVDGVDGWWCKPEQATEGCAIVYLHGGAYVLASAAAYRNFVGQIAARSKVAIFIVDYGIAPEHSFPSAVNDAEAVYRGLSVSGFSKLAIAGDSAGGGLAPRPRRKVKNSSNPSRPVVRFFPRRPCDALCLEVNAAIVSVWSANRKLDCCVCSKLPGCPSTGSN
jgi:epsilon-lactone hydrolase